MVLVRLQTVPLVTSLSLPLLKGSDRSQGPGLTPSSQPSCSCGLSKPAGS